MITSALITQLRREYDDVAKSSQASKNGDAVTTLFNVGDHPIIESSYTVKLGTSARTETTHYTFDKDNGDLTMLSAPANGLKLQINFKYAHWRDQNWLEAINQGIEALNSRGFFRQISRSTSAMSISANVRVYSGPTQCVDLYEVLESDDRTTSGNWLKLGTNWSYQQDANKLILGSEPTAANKLAISYLRNLRTYTTTSATLDVKDDWLEALKKKVGAIFYRSVAGKIAKQGNANIDEGHFSFTNLRTMANDLDNDFEKLAGRKKPTRPAKDIQWHMSAGGVA